MKKLLLTISVLVIIAIAIFIIVQKNVADDISVTFQEEKVETLQNISENTSAVSEIETLKIPTNTPSQPEGEQAENAQNDVVPNQENTPSIDTSNWQTYRNEEYGFAVRYPGECTVYNDDSAKWFLDCHVRNHFTDGSIPRDATFFGSLYMQYDNDLNINQYINQRRKECANLGSHDVMINKTVIDEETTIIKGGCSSVGDSSIAAIFHNNKEYIIFVGNIEGDFTIQRVNGVDTVVNGADITETIYNSLRFE